MNCAGLVFDVVSPDTDEVDDDLSLSPEQLCLNNATAKALAVADRHPDAFVVGADTLVFLDGMPLTKPRDLDEAHAMVRRLAGRTHVVCTGVAIVAPGRVCHSFHAMSEVTFKAMDDEAIRAYHRLVDPLDKAGAYGIQEHTERIIERIEGDFDNVMGMPMRPTLEHLARLGVRPCR